MTKRRVMMMKKKNVKGIKGKEVKRGAQSSAEWVQWPFHLQGGQKRVSSRHAVPSCPTPPFLQVEWQINWSESAPNHPPPHIHSKREDQSRSDLGKDYRVYYTCITRVAFKGNQGSKQPALSSGTALCFVETSQHVSSLLSVACCSLTALVFLKYQQNIDTLISHLTFVNIAPLFFHKLDVTSILLGRIPPFITLHISRS